MMSKYIFDNRDDLEKYHYIRKADRSTEYWFSFAKRKLDAYKEQYNDQFCLILIGSEVEDDFYILPYSEVGKIFLDDYLVDRSRWIGTVRNEILSIHGSGKGLNVSDFYNAIELLEIPDSEKEEGNLIRENQEGYDLSGNLKDQGLRKKIRDFNRRYASSAPYKRSHISQDVARPGLITDYLKELRNFECQICGEAGFKKRNGSLYIEAHHIQELHELIPGSYCSDNIVIVCPNCHSMLHYADTSYYAENSASILVRINDNEYHFERNIIT